MSLWPSYTDIVASCFCGGCSFLFYRALCRQQTLIKAMEDAPELRCSGVINQSGQVIHAGTTGFLYGTVEPVAPSGIHRDAKHYTKGLGVEGDDAVTGVVSKKTITEIILTQFFGIWSTNERLVDVEINAVPFYLVDGNLKVQVRDPLELVSVDLQVVGESYEAPSAGFFTSLVEAVQGFHTTGVKHTQEMLLAGTEVVGVGRLVLKSSGFYLEKDPALPFIVSTQSKDNIIQSYADWLPYMKVGCWLFGAVAVALASGVVYRRGFKAWSHWRSSSSRRAFTLAQSAAKDSDPDDLPAKLSCITCCGLRNAVLVPCAHVAVCLTCINKLSKCPVCRATISSVQPLIYS